MSPSARVPLGHLPRRMLGAVLAVLVPGAGHVVIGYPKAGWMVAAAALALGGIIVGSALACATTTFLLFGAVYLFGTIASVLSVFAVPAGPRVADGARALWPVLVLFVVFRGAAYSVQTWALEADQAPDGAMRPAIEKGDIVLASLRPVEPQPGDVVVVEHPPGGDRHLRRVRAVDATTVELVPDDAREAASRGTASPSGREEGQRGPVPARVERRQLHARALFVFAAARGTNGRDRVWKPLRIAP